MAFREWSLSQEDILGPGFRSKLLAIQLSGVC